ncbi:hypothetical protein Ddye_032500 [Dipteronia dyeriana]|uniref:Mediator complex subunit 15 KIX domain-containing protein n=1 Tax=Dipteronia dyeriana TaxID=168575 RepID=A0AAD9TC51_9ROSI|nr:hypothetical protein Ddye_032744 [Dipteronia dyeriana]KAK2633417.1 hypothetical protein Ddye_032500 [Dipteronia dyeriana]
MDDLEGRRSRRRGFSQVIGENGSDQPCSSNHLPNYQGGESSMDVHDWRTQLLPDSRERIVNKIMATLERCLPYSGPEGFNELRRIAMGFEDKIFSSATSQSDYLRKLSLKMLTMESKNQAVNQEATSDCVPFNKIEEVIKESDSQFNSFNHLPTSQGEHYNINAIDWRNQLPPGSRERIVNKIRETLERHLPFSGPEGLAELKKIAGRFEEKIFSAAQNQSDYLRRISLKMLTMESKSRGLNQDMTTDSVPNKNYSEPMFSNDTPTRDWRTEVLPDSRETIINKIRDTLARNLPFSGPEGSKEVNRIAIRFEGKIFSSASSQSDYLHIISSKMLSLESKCQNLMPDCV